MEWEVNKGNPDSERRQLNRVLEEIQDSTVDAPKGSLIQGANVTLTGDLEDRLLGEGDVTIAASGGAGTGDVVGPASSTAGSLAVYADGTGKVIDELLLSDTTEFLIGDGTFDSGLTNPAGAQSLYLSAHGGAANFTSYRANGTPGAESVLLDNDQIAGVSALGWDGAGYTNERGWVRILAAGIWAVGDTPTKVRVETTNVGSATLTARWEWSAAGHFLPFADNTYDIGSSALKVRAIYVTTQAPLTSNNTAASTEYVDDAVAASGGVAVDVQAFTTAGPDTWTKPSGVTAVCVVVRGGGGGGGAGASLATATVAKGGGGGGAGACQTATFRAADLGPTEDLVVGAAGTAGAPGAAGAAGGDGGAGGVSTFGTVVRLRAGGGGGGRGGQISALVTAGGGGGGTATSGATAAGTSSAAGGAPGVSNTTDGAWGGTGAPSGTTAAGLRSAEWGGGGGGGSTSVPATFPGGSSLRGSGAGGAGGCHTSAPAVTQPSDGGASGSYTSGGGGAAGTSGAVPTAGTPGPDGDSSRGGDGGGGGGSTVAAATAGQPGGDGGLGGGGGGGGGVGMNPGLGGAGGLGGVGAIYVISW